MGDIELDNDCKDTTPQHRERPELEVKKVDSSQKETISLASRDLNDMISEDNDKEDLELNSSDLLSDILSISSLGSSISKKRKIGEFQSDIVQV